MTVAMALAEQLHRVERDEALRRQTLEATLPQIQTRRYSTCFATQVLDQLSIHLSTFQFVQCDLGLFFKLTSGSCTISS